MSENIRQDANVLNSEQNYQQVSKTKEVGEMENITIHRYIYFKLILKIISVMKFSHIYLMNRLQQLMDQVLGNYKIEGLTMKKLRREMEKLANLPEKALDLKKVCEL